MSNNPTPQKDIFTPEEGWHYYTINGVTTVPVKQVEKVLNNIARQLGELQTLKHETEKNDTNKR